MVLNGTVHFQSALWIGTPHFVSLWAHQNTDPNTGKWENQHVLFPSGLHAQRWILFFQNRRDGRLGACTWKWKVKRVTLQRGRGCRCSHTWDRGALPPQRAGDTGSRTLSLSSLSFPAPRADKTTLPREESWHAFQISKSNSVRLSFHYIQVKTKWQGPLYLWEGWPPKWLARQDGLQVTKPLLLAICFCGVRHRTSEGQDSKQTEDESDRDPGRSQGPSWCIWRRKTRLEAPPPPTSSPPPEQQGREWSGDKGWEAMSAEGSIMKALGNTDKQKKGGKNCQLFPSWGC